MKPKTYRVVYVGAPYGRGEYQPISWHRTEANALRKVSELEIDPHYYGHLRILPPGQSHPTT